MKSQFEAGMLLGRKHHAKIIAKGDRWKRMHVPFHIREYLLIPYYVTEMHGQWELFVIQCPIDPGGKVEFIPFARSPINEEITKVPDRPK